MSRDNTLPFVQHRGWPYDGVIAQLVTAPGLIGHLVIGLRTTLHILYILLVSHPIQILHHPHTRTENKQRVREPERPASVLYHKPPFIAVCDFATGTAAQPYEHLGSGERGREGYLVQMIEEEAKEFLTILLSKAAKHGRMPSHCVLERSRRRAARATQISRRRTRE